MPRETKTVQVYPSDDVVNNTITSFENFGWEVIGNQRCQEFTHQDADGTKHYETFNKLTFTRDKDAKWYDEVSELEDEYLDNLYHINHTDLRSPTYPSSSTHWGLAIILLIFYILPGVIYIVVTKKNDKKNRKEYEKEFAKYNSEKGAKTEKLNKLKKRNDEILIQASNAMKNH